jgi:death-on-curing family protein
MKNQTLDNISSNLLARIAKGHPFTDGNKRTAYFGARYFLMKNGADFNGCSYLEASEEMEGIAKKPNFKSAYKYAKQLCEEYIVENQMVVPDYETFYRLVIKSMV